MQPHIISIKCQTPIRTGRTSYTIGADLCDISAVRSNSSTQCELTGKGLKDLKKSVNEAFFHKKNHFDYNKFESC